MPHSLGYCQDLKVKMWVAFRQIDDTGYGITQCLGAKTLSCWKFHHPLILATGKKMTVMMNDNRPSFISDQETSSTSAQWISEGLKLKRNLNTCKDQSATNLLLSFTVIRSFCFYKPVGFWIRESGLKNGC